MLICSKQHDVEQGWEGVSIDIVLLAPYGQLTNSLHRCYFKKVIDVAYVFCAWDDSKEYDDSSKEPLDLRIIRAKCFFKSGFVHPSLWNNFNKFMSTN